MEIKNTKSLDNPNINVLVYGPAGVGKTTLARTCPSKPLIVSAEGGLLALQDADVDYVEAPSMSAIQGIYKYLRDEDHGYEWVIFDSISEIAEVVLAAEKAKSSDPRQAYGGVIDIVGGLLKAFRDLPLNVVAIAKQERVRDEASGLMLYSPMMVGTKLGPSLPYLYDVVCAMRIVEDEHGQPVRALQTAPDGSYDCKDRSGRLPPMCPANLTNIYSLIQGK